MDQKKNRKYMILLALSFLALILVLSIVLYQFFNKNNSATEKHLTLQFVDTLERPLPDTSFLIKTTSNKVIHKGIATQGNTIKVSFYLDSNQILISLMPLDISTCRVITDQRYFFLKNTETLIIHIPCLIYQDPFDTSEEYDDCHEQDENNNLDQNPELYKRI